MEVGISKKEAISEIFQSLRRIVRAFQRCSVEILKECGISGPQLWILKTLHAQNGISVSKLSQKLYLHVSTVSSIIKHMEKHQYIVRKSSKTDRRVVIIHMTPKGGRISLSAFDPIQDNLLFRLTKLSLKDVLKYHQAMQKIAQLMEFSTPRNNSSQYKNSQKQIFR